MLWAVPKYRSRINFKGDVTYDHTTPIVQPRDPMITEVLTKICWITQADDWPEKRNGENQRTASADNSHPRTRVPDTTWQQVGPQGGPSNSGKATLGNRVTPAVTMTGSRAASVVLPTAVNTQETYIRGLRLKQGIHYFHLLRTPGHDKELCLMQPEYPSGRGGEKVLSSYRRQRHFPDPGNTLRPLVRARPTGKGNVQPPEVHMGSANLLRYLARTASPKSEGGSCWRSVWAPTLTKITTRTTANQPHHTSWWRATTPWALKGAAKGWWPNRLWKPSLWR